MKKWILVLVGLLVVSPPVCAKIETIDAQGYGETYEKAVDAALADAVRQVNGMTVSTQSEHTGGYVLIKEKTDATVEAKSNYVQDTKNKNDSFLGNKDIDNTYIANLDVNVGANANRNLTASTGKSAQINTQSAGTIKGYKVKNRDCNPKGCTVVLSIDIDKIERKTSQASSKRDRLAVITTGNRSRSTFANSLRQEITDRIVQSQRFTVLDRSATSDKAFSQEEAFLEGRLNNSVDARQEALPADYLLVINVTEAGLNTTTKVTNINLTGEFDVTHTNKTKVTVRYSLLEAATHGIQWSDSSIFEQGGRYLETARQQISNIIANKIVNKLTPAKVISVTNGKIIINRGETMTNLGDRFDIYSQGEELIDPDTGETLGETEKKVATIIIDSIKDKISYGIVESGKIESIEKGAIARSALKPTVEKKAENKKVATKIKTKPRADIQKLGDSGGVFLK